MSMEIQRLSPLWETFPNHEVQPAEKGDGGAIFADVFRAAIDNVRQAEDEKVKKQYLLSTGQLDNPATLSMALYKAEVATQLFVQVREKALNAYNELSRISL